MKLLLSKGRTSSLSKQKDMWTESRNSKCSHLSACCLKTAGMFFDTRQHAQQQMCVHWTQWVCFCRVWPVGLRWLDHPAPYFAFSAVLLSWECLLVLSLKATVSVTIMVLLFSQGRLLLCGLTLPDCPSSNKTSSAITCDSLTCVSPFLFSTSCGC